MTYQGRHGQSQKLQIQSPNYDKLGHCPSMITKQRLKDQEQRAGLRKVGFAKAVFTILLETKMMLLKVNPETPEG